MKLFITFIISLLVSFSSFANNNSEIKLKLKTINLEGLKIVDQATQLNTFDYDLKYKSHIPLGELKIISKAYNFKFVSSLFISGQTSKFDNIIALVGEVEDQFQLITYFLYQGKAFVVVYNIVTVENSKLIVERVLGETTYTYDVTASQLFPSH